jgi:DNA (cytosine-5)-methyltransferase 1
MAKTKIRAIDFFCSGGGMTYGLRQAGINVVAGVDNDPSCKETYEKNNPGAKFVLADVFSLKERDLAKVLGLKKHDDGLVLVGCSPCQFWSIIQTDKTKSSKTKNLLMEFKRFVDYFSPGYVLVENVPGILSKKNKSGLGRFVASLEKAGYKVHFGIVNMNEYGVPQSRRRFSMLATRLHETPVFPKPDARRRPKVKDYLGTSHGFKKISAGHRDTTLFNHSTAALSPKNIERLKKTRKDGGSWSDWAMVHNLKRAKYRGSGFVDNYGRMSWNKPAPTITTRFNSISNGRFAHPSENRGLSIREGATLQTFPKTYSFPHERINVSARIIGNAVPPEFARRLGGTIVEAHKAK